MSYLQSVYGPVADIGWLAVLPCDEFGVPTLGFEKPSLSSPIPVPDCRNKQGRGETVNGMGVPMGRGMGARIYARRRTALMR